MASSLSLALLAISSPLAFGHGPAQFDSFVAEHARTYVNGSAEYEQRRALFEERATAYEQHNSNPHRLWTAAVNGLTDWTEEELSSLRGWRGVVARGRSGSSRSVGRHSLNLRQHDDMWPFGQASPPGQDLPASVSWAHLESTQTPHDQGACGSCWAYATTLAMEAVHENKRGSFQEFSPQELVDCSPNPHQCGGSGGCHGSTAEMAMVYVAEQGLSIETSVERQEAFLQGFLQRRRSHVTCSEQSPLLLQDDNRDWDSILLPGVHPVPEASPARAFGLIAWERLPENEAEPLMLALVEWGVVAVSVSANYWGGYGGGVFDGCDADATINHAVAMIGYGVDAGTKFWHIQNSWGGYWGENGGIRLIRRDTDDSDCGEDQHPEQGTGCEGGPARVTVCGECGILYDSVVPHFE